MKEQQETNNASPAAAVNLQMWPSAPREGGKGVGGRAEQQRLQPSQAQSLPPTSNQGPCFPASLQLPQLRTSGPPLAPLVLLWIQPEEGRWPCSSPRSSLLLTSELPTQQGPPGQAGSFTDHFCPFFFISGFSFLTLHRHLARMVCEDFCIFVFQ